MAYGFVMDVPAPIGLYDALHAEIGRRAPGGADGLLVHVGRETPVGFQIMEVWESQRSYARFTAEIMGPGDGTTVGRAAAPGGARDAGVRAPRSDRSRGARRRVRPQPAPATTSKWVTVVSRSTRNRSSSG